jgi:peptide chain release factor subunit 1
MLANVKFVQEKRLISRFFDEISQDTGKYVFGVKDTLACLEMGAVETLIVWENLDCDRLELLNTGNSEWPRAGWCRVCAGAVSCCVARCAALLQ